MGLLRRVGSRSNNTSTPRNMPAPPRERAEAVPRSQEEIEASIAIGRYRHLLRTAAPGAVEEVHAEALAKLAPQQRRLVFEELSQNAAVFDRPESDDPRTLAHSAIRSELRQPGFLERTLGAVAGVSNDPDRTARTRVSLLGAVATVAIGSAIADLVMPGIGDVALSGFGEL